MQGYAGNMCATIPYHNKLQQMCLTKGSSMTELPLSSPSFHSLTQPFRGNHVCDGGPALAPSVNEDEGRASQSPPPRAPHPPWTQTTPFTSTQTRP